MKRVLLFALLFAVACGSDAPTTPSNPSPTPGAVTHGSSSVSTPGTCIVTGGVIDSLVDGHSTNGYFSADNKGVLLRLHFTFIPQTDDGKCPQPNRGLWSLQSNGARCAFTGPEEQPFIFVDCGNPGQSQAQSFLNYPDGTSEVIRLDLNVS